MEEKEKRTSKEEEGSGYGLTADSDHCELTTDDRTPCLLYTSPSPRDS